MALRYAASSVARTAVRRPAMLPAAGAGFAVGVRTMATAAPVRAAARMPVSTFAVAGLAATGAAAAFVMADDKVDYEAMRKDIADILESNEDYDDGSYGPVFVRLAWHASGTYNKKDKSGGSGGATMRYNPEKSDGANAGLDVARDLLEGIKKKYPGASYADIWTLAGSVAIEEMGGPKIDWRAGRSDDPSDRNVPENGRLPDANLGASHLRDVFYRMGFNDKEIVALAGAHALGRCHKDRSGFDGPWTNAPTTFSNEFFRLLLDESEKWARTKISTGNEQYYNKDKSLMMLNTDLELVRDETFRKHVETYAKDEDAFRADFAAAFKKLIELGVTFKGDAKPWWKFW